MPLRTRPHSPGGAPEGRVSVRRELHHDPPCGVPQAMAQVCDTQDIRAAGSSRWAGPESSDLSAAGRRCRARGGTSTTTSHKSVWTKGSRALGDHRGVAVGTVRPWAPSGHTAERGRRRRSQWPQGHPTTGKQSVHPRPTSSLGSGRQIAQAVWTGESRAIQCSQDFRGRCSPSSPPPVQRGTPCPPAWGRPVPGLLAGSLSGTWVCPQQGPPSQPRPSSVTPVTLPPCLQPWATSLNSICGGTSPGSPSTW